MRSNRSIARAALHGLFLIAALPHTIPLRADMVLYSTINFTQGPAYSAYDVQGTGSPVIVADSFGFSGSTPDVVTGVQVFVNTGGEFGGAAPDFDVSVYWDSGRGTPGALLDTIATDVAAPSAAGVVTIPAAGPVLKPDELYWLVLSPSAGSAAVDWYSGGETAGFGSTFYILDQVEGGTWTPYSAGPSQAQFQIDGMPFAPVPEPVSMSMMATGLAALVYLRLRRRGKRAI